jgi:hypothetical protein
MIGTTSIGILYHLKDTYSVLLNMGYNIESLVDHIVGCMFRYRRYFLGDFRAEHKAHGHGSRYKRLHCSSLSLHNCPVVVNSRYQGCPEYS